MAKILYAGPDYLGSNGTCWRDAFVALGHEVRTVDDESFVRAPGGVAGRAVRKLRGRPPAGTIARLNECVLAAARDFRPNFTFYVKAPFVLPETLEETAKYGPNLAYMNDDMFNPRNRTFTFFENVKRFDCILTTKSYNVREFHQAGAALAVYLPNAYDPAIHHPAEPDPDELSRFQGDVAFIGTFRPVRADFLARVAAQEFRLNVWGGGWRKMDRIDHLHRRWAWRGLARSVRGGELWGSGMGKAMQANAICLGLLNHENRDLHTSRTFEIPACGGFMLAERTEEHRMYFTEDKEAVYFGSFEEMIDKMRFYLAHDDARRRIARAGYERCLNSAATYADRARFALDQVARLCGKPTVAA